MSLSFYPSHPFPSLAPSIYLQSPTDHGFAPRCIDPLGPSETGKTTVLKQLKLLYGRKGLDVERQTYRRVVHLNAMKAIQALSYGLQKCNIPLEKSENIVHLETVMRLETTLKRYSITSIGFTNPAIPRKITDAKAETDMFLDMVPAIKALWADDGIQECYRVGTNINLQDSAQ